MGKKPEDRYAVEGVIRSKCSARRVSSDYIGNHLWALKKFLRSSSYASAQEFKEDPEKIKDSLIENKSEYLISGELPELLGAIDVLDSIWPLLICVRIQCA